MALCLQLKIQFVQVIYNLVRSLLIINLMLSYFPSSVPESAQSLGHGYDKGFKKKICHSKLIEENAVH